MISISLINFQFSTSKEEGYTDTHLVFFAALTTSHCQYRGKYLKIQSQDTSALFVHLILRLRYLWSHFIKIHFSQILDSHVISQYSHLFWLHEIFHCYFRILCAQSLHIRISYPQIYIFNPMGYDIITYKYNIHFKPPTKLCLIVNVCHTFQPRNHDSFQCSGNLASQIKTSGAQNSTN